MLKVTMALVPSSSLVNDLNKEQRAAVTFGNGPLLIVAGAGTGKTTVITRRIAWLIECGKAKPDEILAVTFTDKAAGEMEERVDRLLPYGYVDLWVMTFHAFCERILQRHGIDIGIPNDFKLLDTTASWMLVRQNLERFSLDYYRPLGNPAKFIHTLLKHFSRAKDEDITPAHYRAFVQKRSLDNDTDPSEDQERSRIREIADAYHAYEQLLVENNSLDFGSLITHTLRLFRERPAILERYRAQFTYILVDEFQDTNLAQYELIKLLAAPKNNLAILSDDDQAIFRFRGASYHNIIQFKKEYPESAEISLITNYRSTQDILDCAYQFIQHNNPNRLEWQLGEHGGQVFTSPKEWLSKKLLAHDASQGLITHQQCASARDEIEYVINTIISLKESNQSLDWSDFAILVRANASAGGFISRFAELDIPYQFLSLRGLYTKPAVIDMLSYCRLLGNYHEGPALYRVLSWQNWELSAQSIIELTHYARQKGLSLWDACKQAQLISALDRLDRTRIEKIIGGIARHAQLATQRRPAEVFLTVIRDTGYLNEIKSADTFEKRESLASLNQLYKKIRSFCTEYPHARLQDFLLLVQYEQEAGDEGRLTRDLDTGPDAVKILTVHAAKGLEFTTVFIVGMVDRRFPTAERGPAIEIPQELLKEPLPEGDIHIQEERRLFYVALTRAKKGIYLTGAHDYGGNRSKKPSLFLFEAGVLSKEKSIPEPSAPAQESFNIDQPRSKIQNARLIHKIAGQTIPLPATFSFTQLAAFRACPLQYKFSFLLQIPVFGKPQLTFGKTMHLTLQRFFEHMLEKKNYAQGGLFKSQEKVYNSNVLQLPSLEVLFELYEKAWIDDWYYDTRQKQEYYEKGKKMLALLYEELLKQGVHTKAVERDFIIKFGVPPYVYSFKGRIDRIDAKEDGSIAIIDYKTGTPKQERALRPQDKEQLLLYQIACEQVFDEHPSELVYHYLENGEKISFLGTPEQKEELKRKVIGTIQKIQTSDFAATPGWHCKSCDFRDICEFRQL